MLGNTCTYICIFMYKMFEHQEKISNKFIMSC